MMLLAMAAFAVEDALIKAISAFWSTGQILLTAAGGGLAIFALVARRSGQPILDARLRHPAVLARGGCEFAAAFLFVTALATAPLGIASAILQAAPIALVAAGALVLGERVGPRRWTAVLAGFSGVLLIVAPWSEAFEPSLLLAVGATVALAGRDLATRFLPPDLGTLTAAFWGYVALVPAGLLALLFDARLAVPTGAQIPIVLALVLLGVVGYYAVTAALRIGEVSAIAPFRYTRLVFAAILGMIFFGERPTPMAVLGIALIVGAGLYAAARERRLAAEASR